eukprot:scaffold75346_cov62-Cyclotella_meneghiniana.AAC.6
MVFEFRVTRMLSIRPNKYLDMFSPRHESLEGLDRSSSSSLYQCDDSKRKAPAQHWGFKSQQDTRQERVKNSRWSSNMTADGAGYGLA